MPGIYSNGWFADAKGANIGVGIVIGLIVIGLIVIGLDVDGTVLRLLDVVGFTSSFKKVGATGFTGDTPAPKL